MDFHDNWDDMDSFAKTISKNSTLGGFELLYNSHTGYNVLNEEF